MEKIYKVTRRNDVDDDDVIVRYFKSKSSAKECFDVWSSIINDEDAEYNPYLSYSCSMQEYEISE